jgi:hypothetical protein
MLRNLFSRLKPASMKSSADWFKENKCPICHHEGFYEGPHGGACVNIQCANESCCAWFNLLPMFDGHFVLYGVRGTQLPEGESVSA